MLFSIVSSLLAATSALGAVHQISVAPNKTLIFSPNNIQAAVGDVVQFTWINSNHTVTQSSFATPCNKSGVASGVQLQGATFNVSVNDTKPIWFYCGVAQHCGRGMVAAINANNSGPNNFDAFVKAAAVEQFGASGVPPTSSAAASSSGSAAPASSSAGGSSASGGAASSAASGAGAASSAASSAPAATSKAAAYMTRDVVSSGAILAAGTLAMGLGLGALL